jgi:hypothetical protein
MIAIVPAVLLFFLLVFLFFREIRLENKKLLEADRLADEHILREVERFVKEQESNRLV